MSHISLFFNLFSSIFSNWSFLCSLFCTCRGMNCWYFTPIQASLSLVSCGVYYMLSLRCLHLCFFSHTATKCPAHWPAHVCKRQALLPQSVSYEKHVRGGTCGDGCSMELATILCHIVHQFGHHEQRPHSHKHKKYTYTHDTLTHIHNHKYPHTYYLLTWKQFHMQL